MLQKCLTTTVITFLKEIHRSADIARHPKMDYTASAKKKNAEKQEKPGLISRRKPREKTVAAVEVPAPSEKPAIPPVMRLNTTVQRTLSRACSVPVVISTPAAILYQCRFSTSSLLHAASFSDYFLYPLQQFQQPD